MRKPLRPTDRTLHKIGMEFGQSIVNEAADCNGHASTQPMQANGGLPRTDQTATVDADAHASGDSRAAWGAESAGSGAPDQAARQADSSALQQNCFSEDLVGIRVCFQLVDLGRQLYVWAGLEGGAMGCMCLASPPAGAHDAASLLFLAGGLLLVCHCTMQGVIEPRYPLERNHLSEALSTTLHTANKKEQDVL